MDNIIFFLTFMGWIMNILLLVLGLVAGAMITLTATPFSYRTYRRWILRRQWLKDEPHDVESLAPQWDEYDPDLDGIGKNCICHQRQLHPGERVLMWPETGPLGILHIAVYCETSKERI